MKSLTVFMFLGLIFVWTADGFAARIAGEDKPVATSEVQKDASSTAAPSVKPKDMNASPSPNIGPVQTPPQAVKAQTPTAPAPAPPSAGTAVEQKRMTISPATTVPGNAEAPERATAADASGQASPPVVPPPVPAPKPARDARYVTIDFDNVDIQVFVKFISELTGKNFIIDDKVKGKVTVISPKKIAVDDVYKVFESVLEVNGFATVAAGDVIKIIPAMDVRGKRVETLVGNAEVAAEDRIVTQIISLSHANADDMKKVMDPLISRTSVIISYPPTGMLIVSDVLSNIKKLREIIDALDVPGVGAQITYTSLEYASANEVSKMLTTIFQQQKGLSAVRIVPDERTNSLIMMASEADTARVRELIRLMDKEIPKSGTSLHIYRLQNANAEDLAKVLMNLPKDAKDPAQKGKSPVLSKDINIIPDKATNTLVITAERADYLVLDGVIKKLDTPRPMVYIEALIMEVSVNKDFKLGVEWRGVKNTGAVTGFEGSGTGAFIGSGGSASGAGYNIIPDLTTVGTTASIGFPGGFSLGILGAGIKIGDILFPSIGAVLQAYQTDQDVSILSTPQLLTVDNEEAEITVGENRPYLTRQESSTVSSTTDYSTYEYKDVGVILKILPHINEDSFVRLKVDQQVTRIISDTTSTRPVTRKRTAKTTVVVKDGETVVIGGLVGDTTDVSTYQVPCLGRIPLFGWLFKTMGRSKEKTNLFVFITPRIIRNQKDAAEISIKKKEELGEIKDGVIKMYEKKPAVKEGEGN
ncbi:MAG: type II secretion system secretin GspD [Deltaproteobacteria bacterium]|nr:type II secretion system secretin GspD [Deltaproteobacteria bacterium]